LRPLVPTGPTAPPSHDPADPSDFSALLWQAIRRCNGQSGLARQLGYNKNSIRQWLMGLALPDAAVEARLAALAGVTQDVMRRAIRDVVMRRFDQSRDLPPVGGPRGRRPKSMSENARRGRLLFAWLLALGLGVATSDPTPPADAAPGRGILSPRRKWAPHQAWRHAA
jgi:hypothetical protein